MNSYTTALSQLTIHLDQIRWNYLSLQKRLKKGADCAAVVKADSYGLGAAEIVPELYKENCRHFFAAQIPEGIAIRNILGDQDAQIYLLNGPKGDAAEEISRNSLIPVLNTPEDIEYWSGFAKKTGKKLPAVIHIDTGMNRLGLSALEVRQLKANMDVMKPIDIRYIMSHLACADEPAHPKNREQRAMFQSLTAELGVPARFSFANSSGIFLGDDYHFDQARPGAALYGINPTPSEKNPMQRAVTLQVRILQIRQAQRGETVGYGASYRVPNTSKLAIISAGYADGILRSLTGSGHVYIHGQKCPMVGRVAMDVIVADISAVKAEVRVGDWAEIIGAQQSVDDIATQAKTIGYEILTDLGARYTRIYSGRET